MVPRTLEVGAGLDSVEAKRAREQVGGSCRVCVFFLKVPVVCFCCDHHVSHSWSVAVFRQHPWPLKQLSRDVGEDTIEKPMAALYIMFVQQ